MLLMMFIQPKMRLTISYGVCIRGVRSVINGAFMFIRRNRVLPNFEEKNSLYSVINEKKKKNTIQKIQTSEVDINILLYFTVVVYNKCYSKLCPCIYIYITGFRCSLPMEFGDKMSDFEASKKRNATTGKVKNIF